MSPTRRQLIKWGIGLGGLAGVGIAGRAILVPPSPSLLLAPFSELAVRLYEALDEAERADVVFDYEHPLRQFHNRGVDTGGGWAFGLRRETRGILVDLVHAGLSESGRQRIPNQFYLNWPGVHVTRVAIFGDPRNPPYQILVTGPHLNLRLGGRSREGVAFGGPQVYGDQRGDEKPGLPGNAYRDQLARGQQLFAQLTPGERKQARQPKAPVQTAVELQGARGAFEGVAVADLSRENRVRARDLAASILASYAAEDVAYAWQCIEHNGGVDAWHLSDYSEDHQPGPNVGDGASQIFRLEGPAAVLYYRGAPHLHAFVNVGMDGERPLSVGEVVAENPAALDRPGVKALFEEVLLRESGADLAYYHLESVAGQLRAGTIRTGDLYNLESWRESVCVVSVEGADLSESLRRALAARGDKVASGTTYRVATTSYVADNLSDDLFGPVESEESGEMLRDAAIRYLETHGFPGAA
jgi:hypothetical protein